MLKKIKRRLKFFNDYRQFGFVLLTVLIALPLELLGFHSAAHIILFISSVINLMPLLWGMIQDLRGGTYGVDILAATAIIASILFKEYWAGMVIILMLTGGEALEDYAERRAKTELTDLLSRAPTTAHLLRGRKILDVKANSVKASDKLIIKPGEVVPVDAVILEGTSSFDESSLTGESLPVTKQAGDQLLSGSINIEGAVTVRALHSADESQYQQIIKLVRSATASKAPFTRLADAYSIPFTIIAFIIAGGAWYVSGDSLRFLQVLVVATPCPLILAAPIALISGMSRAAKQGIIVKTGSAMERLANLKTMAFDKTGTLTLGKPKVDTVVTYSGFNKHEVLAAAAALEQRSNHVLAKAIVNEAKGLKLKIAKAKKVTEVSGIGLSAHINGKDILIGRLGLMSQKEVTLPKTFDHSSVQNTAAFVAIGGVLAGVITFSDEIRPNAKETLAQLKALGIKNFLMVTGDNKSTALAVAKNLNITEVKYEALPGDKLDAIEEVPNRPVGFVGDGVNDSPVLAASDVGIALGARGSTAASESADIVIMLDDIGRIATATSIAKRTFFIAKQSILIGISLSVILMLIFATGKFKPIYGALIQELVDVIVIFNALRAHGPFLKKT